MEAARFRTGPVGLGTSAADILNAAITSLSGPTGITLTQPILRIDHIRIVNTSASAATFNLYIGLTGGSAAGTEFMGAGTSIPANDMREWFGDLLLKSTAFLSGKASVGSNTLVITIEGYVSFEE